MKTVALVEIPAPPEGVYQWQTPFRLDGVAGKLKWAWNTAIPAWTVEIYDGSGNMVAGPVVLSSSADDLFWPWHSWPIPPGEFRVESTVRIPRRNDFQQNARLVYETVG